MTEGLIGKLAAISDLCRQAQEAVIANDFKRATSLLQGEITPLIQTVAHECWREHHVSGRVG